MNFQVFHEITNCHTLTVSHENDLKYNLSDESPKFLIDENVMIMESLEDDISMNHSHNDDHMHYDITEKCWDGEHSRPMNESDNVLMKERVNDDSPMEQSEDSSIMKQSGDDLISESFDDVSLMEQCQDVLPMKCAVNLSLPKETKDDFMSESLKEGLSENFDNKHVPIKLNVTASYVEIYKLRPLKVRCKESLKDLRRKCYKMGLIFCTADSSVNEAALRHDYVLQKCSVPGLYPYENLKQLCKKLDLNFKDGNTRMIKRKVDLILGHKCRQNTIFYLVKWKRLTSKRNSWVSESFLFPEYKSLVSYYNALNHLHSGINQQMIKHFYQELVNRKPYDSLTLIKVCALLFNTTENFIRELSFSFTELKEKTKAILTVPAPKLKKIQDKLLKLMQFSEQRKRVLINLYEWEKDINSFNPASYIEVENHVDLEMAPSSFQFIHDYVRNQEMVEEPICFCECQNCYDDRKSCCPHDSDGEFPYSRHRKLLLLPGYPIYECNKRCKCNSDCINRVVQHGQKVKVAIFRTSNGCGWGLKTLEVIQKDQFVLEYLGEIITSEEAEARGELYDFIGRTYLFDLDYGEGNCLYTVDAGHMGNAGHFINHSCDPNLHVFAVWINNPDPNLPRLALFAKRKINRGEELTFDYKMVKNRDGFGVGCSPPVGVECKCNSKNCRKYLF